jgi:hypothetical protein
MTHPLPVSQVASAAAHAAGKLRGFLDRVSATLVEGWAQNPLDPEQPVMLDVCVEGIVVAQIFADHHRADLAQAGMGSGCHAFRVQLPFALTPSQQDATEVRRSSDRKVLERSAACARPAARGA